MQRIVNIGKKKTLIDKVIRAYKKVQLKTHSF